MTSVLLAGCLLLSFSLFEKSFLFDIFGILHIPYHTLVSFPVLSIWRMLRLCLAFFLLHQLPDFGRGATSLPLMPLFAAVTLIVPDSIFTSSEDEMPFL